MTSPERYKTYRATVNWHKPPGREAPENGQRITVLAAWLMDKNDPFPGELAFTVEEPAGFHHWIPQRDLVDFEETQP